LAYCSVRIIWNINSVNWIGSTAQHKFSLGTAVSVFVILKQ
jgi:hypothetical protein